MPLPYTDETLITTPIVAELVICEGLLEEIRDILQTMLNNQQLATSHAYGLVTEFLSNQDMDDNGIIYGFDFMIDEDDTSIPPVVKQIHDHEEWTDSSNVMSWSAYLATLPPEE